MTNRLPKVFDSDSTFNYNDISQNQEGINDFHYYEPKASNRFNNDVQFNDPFANVKQSNAFKQVSTPKIDINVGEFGKPNAYFASGGSTVRSSKVRDDLVSLVGTKANRRIAFLPELITKKGAAAWVANHHANEGWTVDDADADNDDINDITVYDSKGNVYAINGHVIKQSKMATLQPYYERYPTKKARKGAREAGITPQYYLTTQITGGEKPIDMSKPFTIEYNDPNYKSNSALYQNLQLQHRTPHIPKNRSPYMLFSKFITKPVFDAFKDYLAKSQAYKQFVEVKDGKVSIKDETKYQLPSPSHIWFTAWAYDTYVKVPIVAKLVETPGLIQNFRRMIFDKYQSMMIRKNAGFAVNMANLDKLQLLYNAIEQNDFSHDSVIEAMKDIISLSAGFKAQVKEIISNMIGSDENRQNVCNNLYSQLIQALKTKQKLMTPKQVMRTKDGYVQDVDAYEDAYEEEYDNWRKAHNPRYQQEEDETEIPSGSPNKK